MLTWNDDLLIAGTKLYLDSRAARALCFISHAHSDHLGAHISSIATSATAHIARHRLRGQIDPQSIRTLPFHHPFQLDDDTVLRVTPAGHVLGSAMLHVTRDEGTLLYTGDFKLRKSLTVEPAQPLRADVLVMESTYGLPQFRFPSWELVAEELVQRAGDALRAGRQPIVMGYSLGKAQEIIRILTRAGLPVTLHGAAHSLCELYRELGVDLGHYRRYASDDFHGPAALDLMERGVLVAPPRVARTAFVSRFDNPLRIIMTGWALQPGAIYRYGVDHALPLSDHADFDELLELIERVQPRKIFAHHGFRQFVDELRSRGHSAELARPDPQLGLFD